MKQRAFVIGDVHGMYQMLVELLKSWDKEQEQLIFVGDLIDRGPQIKEVLNLVRQLQWSDDAQVIMGNHEAMLLEVLTDAQQYWPRYQRNGGLTTLAALNDMAIDQVPDLTIDEWVKLTLKNNQWLEAWLQSRPLYLEWFEWLIVHAGVDLKIADWRQTKTTDFYWIREPFHQADNMTNKKIIFGHTPVKNLHQKLAVWQHQNKFGIDGGAVYGGDLIGLHIDAMGNVLSESRVCATHDEI